MYGWCLKNVYLLNTKLSSLKINEKSCTANCLVNYCCRVSDKFTREMVMLNDYEWSSVDCKVCLASLIFLHPASANYCTKTCKLVH